MINKVWVGRIAILVLSFWASSGFAAGEVQGTTSGIFVNPVLDSGGVAIGVGTSQFAWGVPITARSSLEFTGSTVETDIDQLFSLGSLAYYNGTIQAGTAALAVDLEVTFTITHPSGHTETITQTLRLINTPNTGDPDASADIVFLPLSFPQSQFTLAGVQYTLVVLGFSEDVSGSGFSQLDRFFVRENASASAHLFAKITSACAGSAPILEKVSGFNSCPPSGNKDPRWGSFGQRTDGVLEADSGEKLWIECTGGSAFHMKYMSRHGDVFTVGTCPFQGGCNAVEFWHSGDNDRNGKPDCLLRTRWISRDYGDNDIYNAWLNEQEDAEANHPYLDWAETICDMTAGRVSKADYKFEYAYGPPVQCNGGRRAEGTLVLTRSVDPLLGPVSEAFFAAVEQRLTNNPPDATPMSESSGLAGDLNEDGVVDNRDVAAYLSAVGRCRGDAGYNPVFDGDGNGCITAEDERYLFPDNRPPIVACKDQTVSAGAACAAMASIDDGSSDPDAGDTITLTQVPPGPYPLGPTTVTLIVTDSHGASSSCTATVNVVDTTPPTITCPASIAQGNDPGQCSAKVNYVATATDNCAAQSLICNPPSGAVFATGTTVVVCHAGDTFGNTATCSFTVTVADREAPRVAVREGVNPGDKKIAAAGKNAKSGQNPDGYYQLLARDNCDANPQIFVADSASSFVAGPYANGSIVKITQAPGATPEAREVPDAVALIRLNGDGLVFAVDAEGNKSASVNALVPPAPK